MIGLNKRFVSIILACQEAEKKYGFDYETKYAKQLAKFSCEIIEKDLVLKCEDTYFAEQLCMKNLLKYKLNNE